VAQPIRFGPRRRGAVGTSIKDREDVLDRAPSFEALELLGWRLGNLVAMFCDAWA
jgi:hypothetical protein